MAFTRFSSTDPADLAALLNRLGDELTTDIAGAPARAWSSITGKPSTFPPSTHTHSVAQVSGLEGRLAALEYNSGGRDITALCTGVASGTVYLSRGGSTVTVSVYDLVGTSTGWVRIYGLPAGFRPVMDVRRDIPYATPGHQWSINTFGSVYINISSSPRKDTLTFITADAQPLIEPGNPL